MKKFFLFLSDFGVGRQKGTYSKNLVDPAQDRHHVRQARQRAGDEACLRLGFRVGTVAHAGLEVMRLDEVFAGNAKAGGLLGDGSDLVDHGRPF